MAYGAYQTSRARSEEKEARRRMEASRPGIPQSVDRMVSRAERVYTEGLDTSRHEEMVGQRTAAGTRAMREGAVSSTQYLGGVTDMYRAELDSLNQIAMERSAFRMRAHEGVMGALQTRAGYEHQNAMLPYQEAQMDRQVATQAGQAGMQNIWGGLQTGAGAAMQHHAGEQQRGLLRDIYGVGGAKEAPIGSNFNLPSGDAKGIYNMYYNNPNYFNPNAYNMNSMNFG